MSPGNAEFLGTVIGGQGRGMVITVFADLENKKWK